MIAFRTVFFDIVGHCNANCRYCNTGASEDRRRSTIAPTVFAEAIEKLVAAKAIDRSSTVGLYNWGEPLLYPNLLAIIRVLNEQQLRYSLSTNGSVVPQITSELAKNLDHIIFSMPGFSQKSYSRVSGLNFDKVREHIVRMVQGLRRAGFKGDAIAVFHVYQFNMDEVEKCAEFSARHGLLFRPQYAIMNEWRMLHGWLDGSLPAEQMRRISEDLLSFGIRESMNRAPKGYHCPQWDLLVLDDEANVIVCCQTPKDSEFQCGSVIRDDLDSILRKKTEMPVCRDCLGSGLAYYLNNSLGRPAFCETKGHVSLARRAVHALYRLAR